MKFKSIMVIGLILAVLTIGAVSAADNLTSTELTVDDELNVESIGADTQMLSDGAIGEELNLNVAVADEIRVGQTFEVNFTGPDDLRGVIDVFSDYDYFSFEYVDGKASDTMIAPDRSGIRILDYEFNYFNATGQTNRYQGNFTINVRNFFDMALPGEIWEGQKINVNFTGPKDFDGLLDVYFNNQKYGLNVTKGKGVLSIIPKSGENNLYYVFNKYSGEVNFTAASKKVAITAGNFKMDYTSKAKYNVRIKQGDKYVGSGKTVTFYLYMAGKKVSTKTAKTDDKGYASVNFNVAPGSYKIKTKYDATTVTKKYNVNSIIKAKSVSKNKAKNIVLSANLKKVDGKYLKGKKIKFTFYKQVAKAGKKQWVKVKTLSAKTNSKGVVSLTLKKSPVKVSASEMKNGLKFITRISYLKDASDAYFTLYSQNPFKYVFKAIGSTVSYIKS